MISTLNVQGATSRSSRAPACIRRVALLLCQRWWSGIYHHSCWNFLCKCYVDHTFGVFERWEPMLAWVRVAIEHPAVCAGQPWETPNKAFDQELMSLWLTFRRYSPEHGLTPMKSTTHAVKHACWNDDVCCRLICANVVLCLAGTQ